MTNSFYKYFFSGGEQSSKQSIVVTLFLTSVVLLLSLQKIYRFFFPFFITSQFLHNVSIVENACLVRCSPTEQSQCKIIVINSSCAFFRYFFPQYVYLLVRKLLFKSLLIHNIYVLLKFSSCCLKSSCECDITQTQFNQYVIYRKQSVRAKLMKSCIVCTRTAVQCSSTKITVHALKETSLFCLGVI